jgi:hypothetical protein
MPLRDGETLQAERRRRGAQRGREKRGGKSTVFSKTSGQVGDEEGRSRRKGRRDGKEKEKYTALQHEHNNTKIKGRKRRCRREEERRGSIAFFFAVGLVRVVGFACEVGRGRWKRGWVERKVRKKRKSEEGRGKEKRKTHHIAPLVADPSCRLALVRAPSTKQTPPAVCSPHSASASPTTSPFPPLAAAADSSHLSRRPSLLLLAQSPSPSDPSTFAPTSQTRPHFLRPSHSHFPLNRSSHRPEPLA